MRSSTSIIIAIIAAVVILGGAYLIWNANANRTTNTVTVTPTETTGAGAGSQTASSSGANLTGTVTAGTNVTGVTGTTPQTVTVLYNGSSFSPATVTIHTGDTVKFVSSAGNLWVASDEHPTHTGYDGTSRTTHCAAGYTGPAPFDQCATGSSYSFTFTKTGSFAFHNHMNASARGTVIVQ